MVGPPDNATKSLKTDVKAWEETAFIVWIIVVVIIPTIAFLGILGNIASMLVLVRHGMTKSYSIMLMALAVADTSFLTSMFLYFFVAVVGFRYSPNTSYFVFYMYELLRTMDYVGAWSSLSMPVLITVERLVAVFVPLAFKRVVTTFRTKVVVVAVFVWWLGWMVSLAVNNCLTYNYNDYVRQGSVIIVSNSAVFLNATPWFSIIELSTYRNVIDSSNVITIMSKVFHGPVPICFVFVGCIVISVKLKLTSNNRRRIMSNVSGQNDNSPKPSKANAMLMAVCFVYTNASMVMFILHSNVLKAHYDDDTNRAEKLDVILGEVINLTVCVNCSVNFLIYIVMNKKFRDTYTEMIRSNFHKMKLRLRGLPCRNASELDNADDVRNTSKSIHGNSTTSSF